MGLPRLRILRLDRNRLADVHGLARLGSLEALSLRGNAVADPGPLARLPNLRRLDPRGNPVSDAAPLADLRAVVWLAGPDWDEPPPVRTHARDRGAPD